MTSSPQLLQNCLMLVNTILVERTIERGPVEAYLSLPLLAEPVCSHIILQQSCVRIDLSGARHCEKLAEDLNRSSGL